MIEEDIFGDNQENPALAASSVKLNSDTLMSKNGSPQKTSKLNESGMNLATMIATSGTNISEASPWKSNEVKKVMTLRMAKQL